MRGSDEMTFVKFPILPGIYKDDTPLLAKGHAISSDKMRVVRGRWQTIGGWEAASNDTFTGICRGMFSWRDANSQSYTAIGTHNALEVFYDGEVFDITPVVSRGTLTNPFTTVNNDATITVAFAAHGLIADQRITFPGQTTINGADISLVSGYPVTVIDANSFTFEASSSATSGGAGVGGTIKYGIILAPGLIDNLVGPGYGVGGYGLDGYGQGSTDTTFYPRVWTMDNWGENLIACPRGGAIYEWAPLFSATELVTNGSFAVDANWTKGTGWTIGAGVASAASGTASDLEQSITLNPGAYFLLTADITASSGSLQPKIGTTNIGAAITTSQTIQRTFFTDATPTLKFSKDSGFIGTVDNVSVKQLLTAEIIPNAPTENNCIFVSAERTLVACGTQEEVSGDFNALLVRWSAQENNQDWEDRADNASGEFPLSRGGRIVAAVVTRGQYNVWTDKGLYRMRLNPDPNVVYSFEDVGAGCGPISTHAAVTLAGNTYWMANTGEFFRDTGVSPEPLNSTVRRYVFDNIAPSQGEKVYAWANSAFKEVAWLYPDFRDGNECSRYVKYNVVENTWDVGTFDRTAMIDSGGAPYPMGASTTGVVYFHEKGNSADGDPITWHLETGAFDLGDGTTLWRAKKMIPDFEDFLGGCDITFNSYIYPASTPSSVTVSVNSATEHADFLLVGRQISFLLEGNAAPAFMRNGEHRIEIEDTGMIQ